MKDLMVEVDEQCPPHFVYLRVSGDEIRVTVNPNPEAEALAVLRQDVGFAIADELDRAAKSGNPADSARTEGVVE
jgi:hypothetical protein